MKNKHAIERGRDGKDRHPCPPLTNSCIASLSSFIIAEVSLSSGSRFDVMVLFTCH